MLFHSNTKAAFPFRLTLAMCSPRFSHVLICWLWSRFQTAVSGCVLIRTEIRAEVQKNCNSGGMLGEIERVKLSR